MLVGVKNRRRGVRVNVPGVFDSAVMIVHSTVYKTFSPFSKVLDMSGLTSPELPPGVDTTHPSPGSLPVLASLRSVMVTSSAAAMATNETMNINERKLNYVNNDY